MWLGHLPWAGRYWALPFLTVPAPSARYCRQRGRRHKKLTDWARRMIVQLRRWLPHRPVALAGDSSYAVLDLLHCRQSLAQPVTRIARWRLDAALYAPAPPRQTGQNGRPPRKGRRLPALKALLDLPAVSWKGVGSLVRRRHPQGGTHLPDGGLAPLGQAPGPHSLGVDPRPPGRLRPPGTALHRSVGGPGADPGMVCAALATGGHFPGGADPPGRGDPAPVAGPCHRPHHARPAGALLLDRPGRPRVAKGPPQDPAQGGLVRQPMPAFVDAIALVRRHLRLASEGFSLSAADPDIQELPVALHHRLVDFLAYAA